MDLSDHKTATYCEIMQQPDVWLKAYDLVCRNEAAIQTFISNNHIGKDAEIILAGAGTSAFIGNALAGIFVEKGYSQCCKKVFHIIITCNETGDLARESSRDNVLLVLLPPETNDKGLAMTSSFTTMALVSILIFNIEQLPEQKSKIEAIVTFARDILKNGEKSLSEIAARKFGRAVFLGSGALKGIAEECHLKLQELTDGLVVCKFDSFLGFRHGPKAVINKDTVLVYLCSDDEKVFHYERDLIRQINENNKVVAQIAVSPSGIVIPGVNLDCVVAATNPGELQKNEYACIPYVLVGQLLGYFKSENLGLNPDEPSVSGNISRVVEGVKIYDL